MCLNPISRKNPWYRGDTEITGSNGRKYHLSNKLQDAIWKNGLAFMKEDYRHILVPCGVCPECIATKQNALVQRAEVESRSHYLFFCTLTYNSKHLPVLEAHVPRDPSSVVPDTHIELSPYEKYDYSNYDFDTFFSSSHYMEPFMSPYNGPQMNHVLTQTALRGWTGDDPLSGCDALPDDVAYEKVRLPYADIRHVQLLMKNLRDNLFRPSRTKTVFTGRDVKYLAVSELGKKKGRPHFHILFFVEKRDSDFTVLGSSFPPIVRLMESRLQAAVLKYWSINVGTRKNPVYEPLLTYKKRVLGDKVYSSFDLHYVNPNLTTEGVKNVAYYVTKYMMKASEREANRKKFLQLNFDQETAACYWRHIKSKMLLSKGFGLNGRSIVVTDVVQDPPVRLEMWQLAELMDMDDLPPDDHCHRVYLHRGVPRRRMVPDSSVVESLRANVAVDAGKEPYPVFIGEDGVHRPLAHYYKKRGDIFTYADAMTIYYYYDDTEDIPSYADPDIVRKKQSEHSVRLATIEQNSPFDTSPVFLWSTDPDSNENHITF